MRMRGERVSYSFSEFVINSSPMSGDCVKFLPEKMYLIMSVFEPVVLRKWRCATQLIILRYEVTLLIGSKQDVRLLILAPLWIICNYSVVVNNPKHTYCILYAAF